MEAMKRMKSTYRTLWGVISLFLTLTACKGTDAPVPEPLPEEEGMRICWNVIPEGIQEGRALVEGDTDLQEACTSGSGNKAIGIWSAYRLDGDSVKNVLGIDGDVSLVYSTDKVWNNWTGWIYGEHVAYWKRRAVYYFNAYFPKAGGLASIANDSTSLRGTYDTKTTQTDLMVSRVKVDTGSDDFQGSPVVLSMKHTLAALRFQFVAIDEKTMFLQSFSLKNETTGGLSTSGTLVHDDENLSIDDWSAATPASGSFYEWQHPDGGISFDRTTKATAYTAKPTGHKYTGNDGYVLVIPQEYKGATKINVTIDDNPFEVELPAQDFLPGCRYTYLIKVLGDNSLSLTCNVKPWTLEEENLDFEHYVNMDTEGQLRWISGSVEEKANDVNEVFLDAETIQCTFHIATPEGATWYASLVPVDGNDMNAFAFVDDEGNETGLSISGEVGETSVLTIKRKTIKEYTRMRLQLIVKDLNNRTFMVHKDVLGSENYIWCQP